jgi:hypothetical protein
MNKQWVSVRLTDGTEGSVQVDVDRDVREQLGDNVLAYMINAEHPRDDRDAELAPVAALLVIVGFAVLCVLLAMAPWATQAVRGG